MTKYSFRLLRQEYFLSEILLHIVISEANNYDQRLSEKSGI